MSFYGKIAEPNPTRNLRTFGYITARGGESSVQAHEIYFYESGHIGFWNDIDENERVLVLAVKAEEVWEATE